MYFPCCGALCPPTPELPGYKILKRLGQGACGYVYLADDLAHSGRVAIKTLPAPGSAHAPPLWAVEAAEREAVALSTVGWGHVNLVRPLELFLTQDWLGLTMRACMGGTLEAYCKGRPISEDLAAYFLHQLVDVVQHLHANNIAYRDLKLENVLLEGAEGKGGGGAGAPPRLVLADFGCAKRFKKGDAPLSATFLGTPGFMSPQVLATMGNPAGSVVPESARTASGRPRTPLDSKAGPAAASPAARQSTPFAQGMGGGGGGSGDTAAAVQLLGDGEDDDDDGDASSVRSSSVVTTGRFFDAFKADSWALGALLHYMLFSELPYGYDSFAPLLPPHEALLTLLALEHSHTWREAGGGGRGSPYGAPHARRSSGRQVSAEVQDLLDKLLDPDEGRRLSIQALRNHPWLQRPLPAQYAAALEDLRQQQVALNAAAASTNARECRRLVGTAVHKLFALAKNPAVLEGLRAERLQAAAAGASTHGPKADQSQQAQQQQQHAGCLAVPLLCLKCNLKEAPQAAQGLGLAVAHSLHKSLARNPSWSLEAALAAELASNDAAEVSAAAAAATASSNGDLPPPSPQPQEQGGAHTATAATATAASTGPSPRSPPPPPPSQQQQQQQPIHLSRSSGNLVRQQLLEVLAHLDRTAAAASPAARAAARKKAAAAGA